MKGCEYRRCDLSHSTDVFIMHVVNEVFSSSERGRVGLQTMGMGGRKCFTKKMGQDTSVYNPRVGTSARRIY